MISLPEELLEQAERGNALLFIGEHITRDGEDLVSQLAARVELADQASLSFPELAQLYEDEKGRQALVQFLRDRVEEWGDEPQPVHHRIAALAGCDVLVTTNLDRGLERAFDQAHRPLTVIVGNVDVAFEDEHKARLYKLRGSLERPESLVLTEDDYEAFFDDQSSISIVLQGYLARKTILFLGYDLGDPHFKRLYRKVTAPLDGLARRAYAFIEDPSISVSRWCQRHGIELIQAEAGAVLDALAQQLRIRARPAPVVPPQPAEEPALPLPERPYKFLDYYETRDAAIFFARQRETQTLSALIHAHRLVLLHGASGTGKTSLLLAGVVPRLEQTDPPYETIYIRALEDPSLVIRRAVRRRLPEAGLPEAGPLVDFLGAAIRTLGRTLVIILDQFEEFFIRLSPQFRAAFIAELGELYDARDLPIKIVLCLRDDWLASVSEIEPRLPEVFRTRMHLMPLTHEQARQAITAPVERLGIHYEPALVDQLLVDLAGRDDAAVMPPQLQLVCGALYNDLAPDEPRITMAAYQRLGGARGVLQRYLEEELSRLPPEERALAYRVMEELVSAQGTKAVKAAPELALALDADQADVTQVLEKLVRARLLRTLDREGEGIAYELTHEYLVREFSLSPEVQKRKQAEELVKQELENWNRFGTLLGADKLALIDDVRETLALNAEAQELLLHSALQEGQDVDYWLGRVNALDRRIAVLAEATHSESAEVRGRAAQLLGGQDVPEAVEPLLALAVHDPDPEVRALAGESLSKLTSQHPAAIARLRQELEGAVPATRRAVLGALALLSAEGLPTGLQIQALATRMSPMLGRFVGWVLICALAALAALPVGFLAGQILLNSMQHFVAVPLSIGDLRTLTWSTLLLTAVVGLVVGVAQGRLLRQHIRSERLWTVVTVLGGTIGWPIATTVSWTLLWKTDWGPAQSLAGFLALLALGVVVGAILGTAQWVLLRRQVEGSGWWALATIVGLLLSALLTRVDLAALMGAAIGVVTGFPFLQNRRRRISGLVASLWNSGPLVLSLLIGVFIWGAAIILANDTVSLREGRYPDPIPLQFVGIPENLMLLADPSASIVLDVRVTESVWTQLSPDDFLAQADLTGLSSGIHQVPIRVRAAVEPIKILNYEPMTVTVELDQIAERTFPVTVATSGRVSLGYRMGTPSVTPAQVTTRGPASVLRRIRTARVSLDLKDARETIQSAAAVTFLDEKGSTIPPAILQIVPKEQEIVQVTLPVEQLAGYRQVPVRADISEPPPGYQIKTIEITPTTTIVQGTPEALEALSVINTDPIDLSQLDGGQLARRVFLRLPPGVTLPEAQIAQVRVELQPITSTRQLSVAPTVTGLRPNLTVSAIIPGTVGLVIGGPALVLDSLDPGDVSVTLDVTTLRIGTHVLEPVVELPEGLNVEQILPPQVEILIE